MDLTSRLSELEEMVRDAKSMPLSSSALLNRDEVLNLIEDLKSSLPDEIKQARWVVKDREELLAKARRDAEAMVEQARAEQLRLASHEAVMQRAKDEAERIVQEAEEDSRRLRLEAEDYVDAKLAQLEGTLQKILEDMMASNDGLSRTMDQVVGGGGKGRGATRTGARGPADRRRPHAGERGRGHLRPGFARGALRDAVRPMPQDVRTRLRRGDDRARPARARSRRRLRARAGPDARPRADRARRGGARDAVLAAVPTRLPGPVRDLRRRPQPRRVPRSRGDRSS